VFAPFAAKLTAAEKQIVAELIAVQGKPTDIGGYKSVFDFFFFSSSSSARSFIFPYASQHVASTCYLPYLSVIFFCLSSYYQPDPRRASAALRPSATFNAILAEL
jgi:hypothetical protein